MSGEKALVQSNRSKIEARREKLRVSGASEGAYDSTLSELESQLIRAEITVTDLEQRIQDNPKWITAVTASFETREPLRKFHDAFVRQYHALQTSTVWESVTKQRELTTLKQNLTGLNMLVEELTKFYTEDHHEVVKVAAKARRVLDKRHAPSMIANRETGFAEVLLTLA